MGLTDFLQSQLQYKPKGFNSLSMPNYNLMALIGISPNFLSTFELLLYLDNKRINFSNLLLEYSKIPKFPSAKNINYVYPTSKLNNDLNKISNSFILSNPFTDKIDATKSNTLSFNNELEFGLAINSLSDDDFDALSGNDNFSNFNDELDFIENTSQNELDELKGSITGELPDYNKKYGSVSQSLGLWGDFGVLAGLALGASIGGKAGEAISKTATAVPTTINAIKNLKGLKGLKGVKNARTGNIAALAGSLADIGSAFFGEKDEYSGDKGDLTLSLDNVYDGISDAAMSFGPVGMAIGGFMKVGKLAGSALGKIGGSTDGMTTTDAILGSSFLNLTPFGLINSFGGSTTSTVSKDNELFANIGSSYMGSESTMDNALTKSGKKYGLFSSGDRKKAEEILQKARDSQSILENIYSEATDRLNIRNSMSSIYDNKRLFDLLGGYNLGSVRVGKSGMLILPTLMGELPTPFLFGEVPITRVLNGELPNYLLKGELPPSKTRSIEELIEYAKLLNPRFILRMSEPLKYIKVYDPDNENWSHSTHQLTINKVKDKTVVFPMVLEIDGNLKMFTDKDLAYNSAIKNNNFLKFNSEEEAELFWNNYKQAWSNFFNIPFEQGKQVGEEHINPVSYSEESNIYYFNYPEDSEYTKNELNWYNSNDPEAIEFRKNYKYNSELRRYEPINKTSKFAKGGSFNVIPDGSLHARLHHMEVEGITNKGIPVVSENKDGELVQQAEIEKDEIIFRLEVTNKLEDLYKIFYNPDSKRRDKEKACLEAGKLLTFEILENTQDNSNLINTI